MAKSNPKYVPPASIPMMDVSTGNLAEKWNEAVANGDTFTHPHNGKPYIRLSIEYDDINKIRNALRVAEKNPKVGVKIDKGIVW